jgi:hypothetical protein
MSALSAHFLFDSHSWKVLRSNTFQLKKTPPQGCLF